MLFGTALILVAVLVLLGWLVPLILGIRRAMRRAGGTALIIVGGVWGAAATGLIATVAVAAVGFSRAASRAEAKAFNAAVHAGPKGLIRTACTGATTLVVHDEASGGSLRLESANGVIAAPAGTMRLQQFTTSATGADGTTWTAACYNFGRDLQTVDVASNGTTDVALGPPYRAEVTTSRLVDGKQAFDLKFTGAGGSRVSLYVQAVHRKPLQFEVLDASGSRVWSGNFEYG